MEHSAPNGECDVLDVVVLFAALGSIPGAIAGWFIRRRQGAVVGAIAGAILGPLVWLCGIFLLWPNID
jgi:hypothetical protein